MNKKSFHPTLGLITAAHLDMKKSVEHVELQVRTSPH